MVNILKHFQEMFPELKPIISQIIAGIPKMHLQVDCAYGFSLNYIKGAGRTAGELIETVWAELNQANGSAKEMNAGHRHDFLDDMYGNWNWNKVQTMCMS
jgi:hypothetical protein